MKRNILMFGCIIVCLILVSVSYQPLIAEEKPIIDFKEEVEIVVEEDCGCNPKTPLDYPVICTLILFYAIFALYIEVRFGGFPFFDSLDYLINKYDCWWESPLDFMITIGELI